MFFHSPQYLLNYYNFSQTPVIIPNMYLVILFRIEISMKGWFIKENAYGKIKKYNINKIKICKFFKKIILYCHSFFFNYLHKTYKIWFHLKVNSYIILEYNKNYNYKHTCILLSTDFTQKKNWKDCQKHKYKPKFEYEPDTLLSIKERYVTRS